MSALAGLETAELKRPRSREEIPVQCFPPFLLSTSSGWASKSADLQDVRGQQCAPAASGNSGHIGSLPSINVGVPPGVKGRVEVKGAVRVPAGGRSPGLPVLELDPGFACQYHEHGWFSSPEYEAAERNLCWICWRPAQARARRSCC